MSVFRGCWMVLASGRTCTVRRVIITSKPRHLHHFEILDRKRCQLRRWPRWWATRNGTRGSPSHIFPSYLQVEGDGTLSVIISPSVVPIYTLHLSSSSSRQVTRDVLHGQNSQIRLIESSLPYTSNKPPARDTHIEVKNLFTFLCSHGDNSAAITGYITRWHTDRNSGGTRRIDWWERGKCVFKFTLHVLQNSWNNNLKLGKVNLPIEGSSCLVFVEYQFV